MPGLPAVPTNAANGLAKSISSPPPNPFRLAKSSSYPIFNDYNELDNLLRGLIAKVTDINDKNFQILSHISELLDLFGKYHGLIQEEKMLIAMCSKGKSEDLQNQYINLTSEIKAFGEEIKELRSGNRLQKAQEILVEHDFHVPEHKISILVSEAEISASIKNRLEKLVSELGDRVGELLEDCSVAKDHKADLLKKISKLEADNRNLLNTMQSGLLEIFNVFDSKIIELREAHGSKVIQWQQAQEECHPAEDRIRKLESEAKFAASNIDQLEKLAFELKERVISQLLKHSRLAEDHKVDLLEKLPRLESDNHEVESMLRTIVTNITQRDQQADAHENQGADAHLMEICRALLLSFVPFFVGMIIAVLSAKYDDLDMTEKIVVVLILVLNVSFGIPAIILSYSIDGPACIAALSGFTLYTTICAIAAVDYSLYKVLPPGPPSMRFVVAHFAVSAFFALYAWCIHVRRPKCTVKFGEWLCCCCRRSFCSGADAHLMEICRALLLSFVPFFVGMIIAVLSAKYDDLDMTEKIVVVLILVLNVSFGIPAIILSYSIDGPACIAALSGFTLYTTICAIAAVDYSLYKVLPPGPPSMRFVVAHFAVSAFFALYAWCIHVRRPKCTVKFGEWLCCCCRRSFCSDSSSDDGTDDHHGLHNPLCGQPV